MRKQKPFWSMWGWPIFLGVLITFGLLSALLGEVGVWLVLSWLALTIPLLVIVGGVWKKG
jgi:hypothetical protein